MPGRMGPAGRGGARRRTRRRTGRRQDAMSQPQQAAPQQQPTEGASDPMAELEQLGKLHEQGVITDEEFEEKKKKLLAEI